MADSSEKAFPPNNPGSAATNPLVPFVDLKAQYQTIKSEIEAAISRVVESGRYILGPEVEKFEKDFAKYVGARFCVGVNSGTAALQLALMATGVGATDEVIVPANTFFATAETVSTAGARPVFVDADSVAYTIDVSKIENAITPRTRAIIPVHLYGQPADLDPIFEIARRHNLSVIEDAAQAHGAEYKGRRVGALGDVGCFSFYPAKNLGAYGDAGAIVTDDDMVARRLRLLRDHGSDRKYYHELVGYNFRLETLQAAVLAVKLRHLESWTRLRRRHAAQYHELLKTGSLVLPRELEYARHVYHLYVVQSDRRDELQRKLAAAGVQTGIHYPVPIHLQPAYSSLGYRAGDFPETEKQSQHVLSLPMFAELTDEQINLVAETLNQLEART
ncbi:MAG TPA: DegT/DnrJ/EryC1/StrS family aminotransferase [Pyrinomonadaceae bacterium]|nr:DegT/DnrJ/EryC1/StrS family aminotransferase [Pyrinomonadaceae bacterium]